MFAEDGESKVAVGQFTDGKPDGDFVKVYNASHLLVFKGMMVNGEKGTMGTIYYENSEKLMYKGELNPSGVPEGFGREFYETGQKKYCGCVVEGKFSGDGELWDDKGRSTFQGTFDSD
jgi:antitoxin component YwqK of YwqJK toxin-antitoxin module